MKKLLFFLVCGLIGINSHAQVSRYLFSQANNTFDTLTTGTVVGSETTATGTYFVDPSNTPGSTSIYAGIGLPIGFNFVYNDSTFNVFGINADGWISFGKDSVDMNSSAVKTPISATSGATAVLQNRVSALGNILSAQTGSQLSYSTIGLAPYRILVVEWKRYTRSVAGDEFSFQIMLYETTNVVEFTYGKFTCSTGSSNAEVGLRGMANTDFLNRTTSQPWSNTTAGAVNNSSCLLSSSAFPDSSRTFIFSPPPQTDAGVTIINYPVSPRLSTGTSKIALTIENFGTDTLKTDSVYWTVNGALQTPFYWSGKLAYDSISKHDTIGSYNFATAGVYIIKAWSRKPNNATDQNYNNDTSVTTIYVGGYASLPFVENFDGTWINFQNVRDVPSVYWTNTPSTGNNSWRRDDDTISASWTSGNVGKYSPRGANGSPHSARFHSAGCPTGTVGILDLHLDFSTVGTKMLNFYYRNDNGFDSLAIYGSGNGGASWVIIKKYYLATTWKPYSLNLGATTYPNTILRFKTTSHNADTSDIGIDNIQVSILTANDMAAIAWIAPTGGCGMTSTDTVKVKVANVGTSSLSNIPIYYSINGGFSYITESIPGPVIPGDTLIYKFQTTADFSGQGEYHCLMNVFKTGDSNLKNDTLSSFITSLGDIAGNPFIDSLEKGNSHYTFLHGINSSVALDSLVGDQRTHGFYFNGGASGTWAGGATTTTPSQAFSYGDHVAKISTCNVNDTAFPVHNCYLTLDLKQDFSTGNKYSYFTVVLNRVHGIDTLSDISGKKYFNPVTANSDPFAHKIFNLSAYVDSSFTLNFISSCNTATDSVHFDNIILSAKPVVKLGPADTTFCPGSLLDAGAAPLGYSYYYNWSTKKHPMTIATTRTINADSAATYFVTVDNGFGIKAVDSIVVSTLPAPGDSLNRYNTGCAPFILNPGIHASYSYTWSTVVTTPTIAVSSTGNYWVDIKHSYGCVTRDSAHVIIIPKATVNAGPGQLVCYLDTVNILSATVANQDSLRWSTAGNGHFLKGDSLHTKYVPGTADITNKKVVLKLTAYSKCDTISDTLTLHITTAPSVDAGINDTICKGNHVQLTATGATSFSWSPSAGLSSTSIQNPIAHPTVTTTYFVTGISSCGSAKDSVIVAVDSIVAPSLGPSDTLCAGSSVNIDAGSGYNSYLWSTGSTNQIITVDSSGIGISTKTFKVIVTKGACSDSAIRKITFRVCTGIIEYNKNASISIFPNPTTGLTNLTVNGINGNALLNIYSIMGQSVYSKYLNGINKTELDLSNLSKGVYFVRINNEKVNILSKMIIQ